MPARRRPTRTPTTPRALFVAATLALAATLTAAEFTPPTRDQCLEALGSLEGEPFAFRRLLTPDEDFAPIEAPEPNDWLATYEEPGQTYANFVLTDVQRASETRKIIYLQPLGEFPADSAPSLDALRDYAAAFFQLDVVLLPTDVLESAAFEPRINTGSKKLQLRSTAILSWLRHRLPDDAFCLVAVTMTDLYPEPSWNFVYGQASSLHRTSVFSFARDDPSFFGQDRPDDFDALLLRRSCKTLVHEIAHNFGLAHCIYFRCVENGVNHRAESDSRPHHLCPVCLRKLRYATSADLETRYRDLAYFYSQHSGWDDEEAWVRKQLAKLRSAERPRPTFDLPGQVPVDGPAAPVVPLLPIPSAPTPDLPSAPAPAVPPGSPGRPPPSDAAAPPIPTPTAATEPLVAVRR